MAASRDRAGAIDAFQGLFAFVGVTLGVIPMVRWAIQEEYGALFEWLFGVQTGSMGYVTPLAVIVAVVGAIAALEMMKRRA
jgi:hypothetical protein